MSDLFMAHVLDIDSPQVKRLNPEQALAKPLSHALLLASEDSAPGSRASQLELNTSKKSP